MLFGRKHLNVGLLSILLLFMVPLHAAAKGPSGREKQLRKRVDQIYRLFITGDWEKVTPLISEQTRQLWISASKGKVNSFSIDSVEIAPDGKHATVKVMVTVLMPQFSPTPVSRLQWSDWVYEKGKWFMAMRGHQAPSQVLKLEGVPPTVPGAPMPPMDFGELPPSK